MPRDRLQYAHSGDLEHKFRYSSWTLFLIAERALWVAHSITARFKSDDPLKPANFCVRPVPSNGKFRPLCGLSGVTTRTHRMLTNPTFISLSWDNTLTHAFGNE